MSRRLSAEDQDIVDELALLLREHHRKVTWDHVWLACRVLLQARPSNAYRMHVYRLVQDWPELEAMRIFLGMPRDLPGVEWNAPLGAPEVRMTIPPPIEPPAAPEPTPLPLAAAAPPATGWGWGPPLAAPAAPAPVVVNVLPAPPPPPAAAAAAESESFWSMDQWRTTARGIFGGGPPHPP